MLTMFATQFYTVVFLRILSKLKQIKCVGNSSLVKIMQTLSKSIKICSSSKLNCHVTVDHGVNISFIQLRIQFNKVGLRAGSGSCVFRIDTIHFLAGCRKRRLNQC